MSLTRNLLALLLSAILLAALPATAAAQSDFHIFIGTATHDGQVPPVGTEITAYGRHPGHRHRPGPGRGAVCPADFPGPRHHRLPHRPGAGRRDLPHLAVRWTYH